MVLWMRIDHKGKKKPFQLWKGYTITRLNSIGLKPGDTVQLSNFTDNTFQASLKFIVQKSIPRPSVNASSASIFMSEIAAKRIGFEHYKREGVIDLKLIRFDDFQPKRLDNDINTTK